MKACRLSRLHTRFTKAPPAQCWERLYQMVPLYEKSRRHSHLSGLSAANHIISSHADGAMTHAARCSQCGQCRRQNGYNHLAGVGLFAVIRIRRVRPAHATTVVGIIGILHLASGCRHTLHLLAVAVVAGNLDGGVSQLVLQVN